MSTSSSRTATRRTTRATGSAASRVAPTEAPDGSQIPLRTVLLVTELKRVGNRKKVSSARVEVDADKEAISVSKTLLDAPQLLDIINYDTAIRRLIGLTCLPSFFRGGMFLLPLQSVERVESRLQEMQEERARLVSVFLSDYPQLVETARARLRGLFEILDYPAVDAVAQEFDFSWRYLSFDVPATLQAIDLQVFNREREKQARQWDEAAGQIQTLLRANLLDLVANMNERLAPTADGQRKIFKNSLVSNLTDFLKTFDARNIVDDAELARVCAQARSLLEGVDPQLLRESQDVRAQVQTGFAQVQRELSEMVVNRPTRRIVMQGAVASTAAASATAQQSVPIAA